MPGAVVSLSTQNIKSVWAISTQLARVILGCVCVCVGYPLCLLLLD